MWGGLKVSKGVPRYVEAAVDCVDEEGRLDGTMYYDNPPIQPGDLLLTADGVAVTSLPLPELVKILRGPHHSVLEMTLSNSEHQTYTVRLLRHKPHEFDHQLIGAEPAPLAPYVPAHAAGAPSPQTAQVAPQLQATASGVQAPVVEDGARHSSLYTKQMPTSGTEQVQKQEHVSPPPQQEPPPKFYFTFRRLIGSIVASATAVMGFSRLRVAKPRSECRHQRQ